MTKSEIEYVVHETKRQILMENYKTQIAISDSERRMKLWIFFIVALVPPIQKGIEALLTYLFP